MAERYREKWSREETILAFDLYCKTSFSKISKTNKDIIALAELLGRTPSSVGLKMANLAHYDPELIARNVKGMSNTSKLDKEIVEEFNGDWEKLSYQAQILRAKYAHTDIQTLNPEAFEDAMPDGMDVQKEMKIRLGQYFFRLSVLNAYGNSCCITGIQCPGLLIASHIKPWSVSDSKTERTNPRNGLCLNSLHDKAFDKGLITIDKNYRVIFSPHLTDVYMDESTHDWFYKYEKKEIQLPDKFLPGKDFIEYHNDMVFQQ